jgi:16S rRNA (cytosine1402-N4)-methyltransferase
MSDFPHESVLLEEVLEALSPQADSRILDVTLGLGGHASALLNMAGSSATLVGLDADEENLLEAQRRLETQVDQCKFIHANFSQLSELDLGTFDIIFADLGVSSPHFDEADRGFSFRKDGPLDMRFDRSQGHTAADLIQKLSEQELSEVLRDYGQIPQHGRLAEALKKKLPQTTFEAFSAIEGVVQFNPKSIAPQMFQALRIVVNDELGALETLLDTAPNMLKPNGRLGIIAFHSLEDTLVKKRFRELSSVEKDETTGADIGVASFSLLQRKAIKPSAAQEAENPRSRSARLRVIKKR